MFNVKYNVDNGIKTRSWEGVKTYFVLINSSPFSCTGLLLT